MERRVTRGPAPRAPGWFPRRGSQTRGAPRAGPSGPSLRGLASPSSIRIACLTLSSDRDSQAECQGTGPRGAAESRPAPGPWRTCPSSSLVRSGLGTCSPRAIAGRGSLLGVAAGGPGLVARPPVGPTRGPPRLPCPSPGTSTVRPACRAHPARQAPDPGSWTAAAPRPRGRGDS